MDLANLQLRVENTEEAGREAARMAWKNGTNAGTLRTVGALLETAENIPNPEAVRGFNAEVDDVLTCWNGYCTLPRHDGDNHNDNTGNFWTQARGTKYCPVCLAYTTCQPDDHDS